MILKILATFSLILFSNSMIHAQETLLQEDDTITAPLLTSNGNDTFPQLLGDKTINETKPKVVKNQPTQNAVANSGQSVFSKLQYSYDQIPEPFKIVTDQPLSFTKVIMKTPTQIIQSLIENFITLQLKWLKALGAFLIPQRMPGIMQKVNSAPNNGNVDPSSILGTNNIIPQLDLTQLTQALNMPDTITQGLKLPGIPQIPFMSQTQKPNPTQNLPLNTQPSNYYQTPNYYQIPNQPTSNYQNPQNYQTPTNYQTPQNYKTPNYQTQIFGQQPTPDQLYNSNYLDDPSSLSTGYDTQSYPFLNYPESSPMQTSSFSSQPMSPNHQRPSQYNQNNTPYYNGEYGDQQPSYLTPNSQSTSGLQYVYGSDPADPSIQPIYYLTQAGTPINQDSSTQSATPNYSSLRPIQPSGYSTPAVVTSNYQNPQTPTPNYSSLASQQTGYSTPTATSNYPEPSPQNPNYSSPANQPNGYSTSTVTSNYQNTQTPTSNQPNGYSTSTVTSNSHDPVTQLTSSPQSATPNNSNQPQPVQKSSYSTTATSNYQQPLTQLNRYQTPTTSAQNNPNYYSTQKSAPKSSNAISPQTAAPQAVAPSRLPTQNNQRPSRPGGFFGGMTNGITGMTSSLSNGISGFSTGITNGLGNLRPRM